MTPAQSLTAAQIFALRKSVSPWPHAQATYRQGLKVTYHLRPYNRSCSLDLHTPYYSISDSEGYLCATQSAQVLTNCLQLESQAWGALRELLTGASHIESLARSEEQENKLRLESLTLKDLDL